MLWEIPDTTEEGICQVVREIEALPADALVLDVGGGVKPLHRANWMVDLLPYARRGGYGYRGSDVSPERYTESTWRVADISDLGSWYLSKGFPAKFDFVFCSQVLEDIRNPISVIELLRSISTQGFISVPHWTFEASIDFGVGYVGYPHHRWLVNFREGELEFMWKSPLLHAQPNLRPCAKQQFLNLRWDGYFPVREVHYGGEHDAQEQFLRTLKMGV